MKPFSLGLLVLAMGCTPVQWTRSDAPKALQVEADLRQCEATASQDVRFRYMSAAAGGTYPGIGGGTSTDPLAPHSAPYTGSALDPVSNRNLEQVRLARLCMQGKGYELAQIPKR